VTERAAYIGRIRNLSRSVAQAYFDSRERLGFPMLAKVAAEERAEHANDIMRRSAQGRRPEQDSKTDNMNQLVELVTEELPPKAWPSWAKPLPPAFSTACKAAAISKPTPPPPTPRRAAWPCPSPACAASPDKSIREKVLPVPWRWTPKAAGRAAGEEAGRPGRRHRCHRDHPDQLERAQDGKAESFFYTYTAKGSAWRGLQAALEESLSKLPIPKVMSYQRQFGARRRDRALRASGHYLVALLATTWCRSTRWAWMPAAPRWATASCPPGALIAAPTPTPPWPRKARSSPASPSAAKRSAPRCWPRPVPTRC
jgi:hypothetical protein